MSEKLPPTALIDYPWNTSNLTVHVNTTGLSGDDIQAYKYNALIACRWWEREGTERLGYKVNFTITDDSEHANISINWRLGSYTTNEDIRGHIFINATNQLGDSTCDIFNLPFTKCNISIKRGISDVEMQTVIKHEIGHAFTLTHSFNETDFKVRTKFGINYMNSPSDIMFDDSVVEDTIEYENLVKLISIFGIIFSIIIMGSFWLLFKS